MFFVKWALSIVLWISFSSLLGENPHCLKINIFSACNGKGLETSRRILRDALQEMGHVVFEREFNDKKLKHQSAVDVNIFFEIIVPEWLSSAYTNWFIPNPECYLQKIDLLNGIDLIVCRTHEVERIFKSLDKKTFYLGFSSLDCENSAIEKDFFAYLHLAGSSPLKGTNAIMEAWQGDLDMPYLTAVLHFPIPPLFQQNLQCIHQKLPLKDVRFLQNRCGVHLCLSETEGFGHYLMEAMSTGAVVVTTDAPPMNEFILDRRCLVAYNAKAPLNLGVRYFVDPIQLKLTIDSLKLLSLEELQEIGEKNRTTYLLKTQEFQSNLQKLLEEEFIQNFFIKG